MRTFYLGEICLHTWGSLGSTDKPALLLLHGFMQSGASWDGVAEILAKDHYVVAPDLIGHGESLKPTDPLGYTFDAYTMQIVGIVQHLQMQGFQVALVGYSMGGRLAAHFLTQQEGMLCGVVLESAGLGPVDETERQKRAQKSRRMAQRLIDDTLPAFVDFWENLDLFASQKELPEDVREAVRADRLDNEPYALVHCLTQAGQHRMGNLREAIGQSDVPVLYLAGEKDVAYTEIARSLTGVKTQIIPDAGHNIHLEQPQAFADAITDFLG